MVFIPPKSCTCTALLTHRVGMQATSHMPKFRVTTSIPPILGVRSLGSLQKAIQSVSLLGTLPEKIAASLLLKFDGWKMICPFGKPHFQGLC